MNSIPTIAVPQIAMPVNFEAEQALLGTLMMRNKAYLEVAEIIEDWHFADETHRKIFSILKTMIQAGNVANPVTIKTAFAQDDRLQEVGGTEYLMNLCGLTAPVFAADYARSVVDCALRREIIGAALDAIGSAEAGEMGAEEIAASAVTALSGMRGSESGFVTMDETINDIIQELESVDRRAVYPTGMRRLDAALGGGLYAGKFYGISARHKVGKTNFLTSVSYSLCFSSAEPVPHVYICGEMNPKEIGQRLLARGLGINSLAFLEMQSREGGYVNGQWMTREYLAERVRQVKADFSDRGLTFLQKPRLSLDVLKATIAQAAMSGKYRGVIVDYLQMVTGQKRGQSQADHLDDVAQTCVEAAKQHGLWVIAAAQLNREGFVRGGDGLMNACDMAFVLNRQTDGNGGLLNDAWLEMTASRYTPYRHLGTEETPGLRINVNVGPHFEEYA